MATDPVLVIGVSSVFSFTAVLKLFNISSLYLLVCTDVLEFSHSVFYIPRRCVCSSYSLHVPKFSVSVFSECLYCLFGCWVVMVSILGGFPLQNCLKCYAVFLVDRCLGLFDYLCKYYGLCFVR